MCFTVSSRATDTGKEYWNDVLVLYTILYCITIVSLLQLYTGRRFSPGTPASSTTKSGRYDIAESGINHQKSIKIIITIIFFTLYQQILNTKLSYQMFFNAENDHYMKTDKQNSLFIISCLRTYNLHVKSGIYR